jgi:uncharacterized membrane protein YidH (DUF202 family)
MNSKSIIAFILIAIGVIVLAYSGITYTTRGKSVEILGLHIEKKEKHFIPPVAGAMVLAGGIILLLVTFKRKN